VDVGTGVRVSVARTLLRLGRVSNLPTVWTNCLAGAGLATAGLAGAEPSWQLLALAAAAMSVVYTGGMFLNDAFDRGHDATHAATRPIPAGAIRASTVFVLGFFQLMLGVLGVGMLGARAQSAGELPAVFAAIALVLLVVLYDLWHKANPLAPLLMAGCRALVYVTVGLLASGGRAQPVLWLGSLLLFAYVVGLSWLGRLEAKGLALRVPGGFATFIAGISLVDALLLAGAGRLAWAAVALLGFPATRVLQRWVRGT